MNPEFRNSQTVEASPEADSPAAQPDELDKDELPRDELPKDDLPKDELPKDDLPKDELPRDLIPQAHTIDYAIPNNSRRRAAGALYVFIGTVFAATWLVARGADSALLNAGFLAAGLALLGLGCHHILTGKDLKIDDTEALKLASAAVPFDLGHASAQLGWRGWLSRPTWKVLIYSNEPQPSQRALVRLDGFSGAVVDMLVEDNPEDWSELMKEDESADEESEPAGAEAAGREPAGAEAAGHEPA